MRAPSQTASTLKVPNLDNREQMINRRTHHGTQRRLCRSTISRTYILYLIREWSVKDTFDLHFTTFRIFLCPRDRRLGEHFVFVLSVILSFCNSVLLSETLTLLITFEQWVLELIYITLIVFPVIRPFRGYHYFLPSDLDLGVWLIFWKL